MFTALVPVLAAAAVGVCPQHNDEPSLEAVSKNRCNPFAHEARASEASLVGHTPSGTPPPRSFHPHELRCAMLGPAFSIRPTTGNLLESRARRSWIYDSTSRLAHSLKRYRVIERLGGLPVVGPGPVIGVGDADRRVRSLRALLVSTGDLPRSKAVSYYPDRIDTHVVEALIGYQARHGITKSGTLDEETVAAMGVSVRERIRTIILNIERKRWLATLDLGYRHVWVNVPSYEVRLNEGGRPKISMRAIVGSPVRQTPMMSHRIEYLEINPYWVVPESIFRVRLLPRVLEDPEWLSRSGFELIGRQGRVEPMKVDWEEVARSGRLPYMVRQRPGPANAMGSVKFVFPNERQVILHDTPQTFRFEQPERAFSYGCVRVERPAALLRFVMRGKPQEKVESVEELLDARGRRPTRIDLDEPVPVHLVYLTAWADDLGRTQFRRDIYKLDHLAKRDLDRSCPGWDDP